MCQCAQELGTCRRTSTDAIERAMLLDGFERTTYSVVDDAVHAVHVWKLFDNVLQNADGDCSVLRVEHLSQSYNQAGCWLNSHEPTFCAQLGLTAVAGAPGEFGRILAAYA